MNGVRPKFQLLDIVVASPPESGWRFSGRGSIGQVRQYGSGRFTYAVSPLDDDDAVGAIFDEDQLKPTGERQDQEAATRVGPFRSREVVKVMTPSEHSKVVGLTGIVVGSCDDQHVSVWIDDLEEVFIVPIADLETTGVRRPSTRQVSHRSLRVDTSGGVLGHDDYVVLQDLDDL